MTHDTYVYGVYDSLYSQIYKFWTSSPKDVKAPTQCGPPVYKNWQGFDFKVSKMQQWSTVLLGLEVMPKFGQNVACPITVLATIRLPVFQNSLCSGMVLWCGNKILKTLSLFVRLTKGEQSSYFLIAITIIVDLTVMHIETTVLVVLCV